MFRVEELTKRFGGLKALDRCTFTAPPNTITGIVGPNGAGKTTLFDVITGFITADAGSVYFQGRNITGLPPHTVARLGIVRTFQLLRLYRDLSVIDNLLLARWSPALPLLIKALLSRSHLFSAEERLRAECDLLLAKVGLLEKSSTPAGELSYGQQKMLEILRTMVANPVLFLFDEPTAGLDPATKETVSGLIRILKEQGRRTVILIEHDLGFVQNLCDQVVVLDQGAPIFTGPPEALAGDPLVKDRYLSKGKYL
jgi:ABC-type branched-subunit amino acid transport system ATPase component